MAQATQAPANGATKNPALVAVSATPTPKTEKAAAQGSDVLPLEDRLHRLNQLFHLQQKYNKLQESLQKLSEFEISKDGERCSLRIQDEHRNDFTTYHPEVVQDVTEFIKVRIKAKIKELEPQLKW